VRVAAAAASGANIMSYSALTVTASAKEIFSHELSILCLFFMNQHFGTFKEMTKNWQLIQFAFFLKLFNLKNKCGATKFSQAIFLNKII